jgi:hypothetical protein
LIIARAITNGGVELFLDFFIPVMALGDYCLGLKELLGYK